MIVEKTAAYRYSQFLQSIVTWITKMPNKKKLRTSNVSDALAKIGLRAMEQNDFDTASKAFHASARWYFASKEHDYWNWDL